MLCHRGQLCTVQSAVGHIDLRDASTLWKYAPKNIKSHPPVFSQWVFLVRLYKRIREIEHSSLLAGYELIQILVVVATDQHIHIIYFDSHQLAELLVDLLALEHVSLELPVPLLSLHQNQIDICRTFHEETALLLDCLYDLYFLQNKIHDLAIFLLGIALIIVMQLVLEQLHFFWVETMTLPYHFADYLLANHAVFMMSRRG